MVDTLVFLFGWLGHAVCWLVLLNLLYSQPYHRTFLKIWRFLTAIIIFVLPPVAWIVFADSPTTLFDWDALTFKRALLTLYVTICLFVAVVMVPAVTIQRWLQTPPVQILEESTRQLDVVSIFGHRPIGNGKHASLLSYSWNQFFEVDFTELTLKLPNRPNAWDGLTILHLSDLHFIGSPSRDYYETIFEACMNQGVPDLVFITGDLVDSNEHIDWIAPLLSQLRWNIAGYVILGNHDWWYDSKRIRRVVQEIGFREIGNRWEQILVRDEPMTIIGHEGPWFRPGPDLSECPGRGFRVCLSHSPDNLAWCRKHCISLMLSGHNHGGQIRIPLFGSLFVPSKYSRRYDMGTFFEPPTLLHVNRGLGAKEPIRIRCNPQVTRIVFG